MSLKVSGGAAHKKSGSHACQAVHGKIQTDGPRCKGAWALHPQPTPVQTCILQVNVVLASRENTQPGISDFISEVARVHLCADTVQGQRMYALPGGYGNAACKPSALFTDGTIGSFSPWRMSVGQEMAAR